jgi:diguanylate cyclase (GGDEF)-like protein
MGLEVARIERRRLHPVVRGTSPERGLVFVLVDIDNFKRVNDTHGHLSGDAVLAQLAALLTETTWGVDLVARWGGEEFLVVATDVDLSAAFPLPERIRSRVEERLFALPGGKTLHCTCSIGVAVFSPEGDALDSTSWDQTIMEADRALYAAKAEGRNRVVFANGFVSADLTPAAKLIPSP